MTPEEAREIDRLEFEADCLAARERAYAVVAERRGLDRARSLRWIKDERPKPVARFNPKPVPAAKPPALPIAKLRRKRAPSGQRRTAFGKSLTLREWAEYLGISLNTLHQRMHKKGSLEDAIAVGGLKRPHRPKAKPGVVENLPAPNGTGGGSVAQEIS